MGEGEGGGGQLERVLVVGRLGGGCEVGAGLEVGWGELKGGSGRLGEQEWVGAVGEGGEGERRHAWQRGEGQRRDAGGEGGAAHGLGDWGSQAGHLSVGSLCGGREEGERERRGAGEWCKTVSLHAAGNLHPPYILPWGCQQCRETRVHRRCSVC